MRWLAALQVTNIQSSGRTEINIYFLDLFHQLLFQQAQLREIPSFFFILNIIYSVDWHIKQAWFKVNQCKTSWFWKKGNCECRKLTCFKMFSSWHLVCSCLEHVLSHAYNHDLYFFPLTNFNQVSMFVKFNWVVPGVFGTNCINHFSELWSHCLICLLLCYLKDISKSSAPTHRIPSEFKKHLVLNAKQQKYIGAWQTWL